MPKIVMDAYARIGGFMPRLCRIHPQGLAVIPENVRGEIKVRKTGLVRDDCVVVAQNIFDLMGGQDQLKPAAAEKIRALGIFDQINCMSVNIKRAEFKTLVDVSRIPEWVDSNKFRASDNLTPEQYWQIVLARLAYPETGVIRPDEEAAFKGVEQLAPRLSFISIYEIFYRVGRQLDLLSGGAIPQLGFLRYSADTRNTSNRSAMVAEFGRMVAQTPIGAEADHLFSIFCPQDSGLLKVFKTNAGQHDSWNACFRELFNDDDAKIDDVRWHLVALNILSLGDVQYHLNVQAVQALTDADSLDISGLEEEEKQALFDKLKAIQQATVATSVE